MPALGYGREHSHIHSMAHLSPEEAKAIFRNVWASFLFERGDKTKSLLGKTMASLRDSVSRKPSKEWSDFVGSLPGYREMVLQMSGRR